MKTLMVSDTPIKVGSRSIAKVRVWLDMLAIREPLFIHVGDTRLDRALLAMKRGGYPIVALGATASKACRGTKHFTMPHPSGRNRLLNNHDYVELCIKRCRAYLSRFK
jgi:hypothetical protein